jgi:hypothetical protein
LGRRRRQASFSAGVRRRPEPPACSLA